MENQENIVIKFLQIEISFRYHIVLYFILDFVRILKLQMQCLQIVIHFRGILFVTFQ